MGKAEAFCAGLGNVGRGRRVVVGNVWESREAFLDVLGCFREGRKDKYGAPCGVVG